MKGKFSLGKLIKFLIIGLVIGALAGLWAGFNNNGYMQCLSEGINTYAHKDETNFEMQDESQMSDLDFEYFANLQKDYNRAEEIAKEKGYKENIDGVVYRNIIDMMYYSQILAVHDLIDYILIGLVTGPFIGILLYLLFNLKVKYTILKLIIGYILAISTSIIVTAVFRSGIGKILEENTTILREIKTMFEYHAFNFVLITTLIYIVIVISNLLIQRKKAELLNKELLKDNK